MASNRQVGFGIDFGTTNSVVGVCEGGPTRALLDGDKPNPSVVWYAADGNVTVGRKAKNSLNGYSDVPGNTFVNSVKLSLGKSRSYRVAGQPKSAPEVASEIFSFLLRQAREQHSLDVKEGVVTIPVDFDGAARHELRLAAERAGFYVKTFIHEPFAAVVAYCFSHQGKPIEDFEGRNILVFDWGGGTLDITLAAVRSGRMIQVAKADLGHRAGDYFDEKILRLSHQRFLESSNLRLDEAPVGATLKDRYLGRCEAAKLILSDERSADLDVTSAFRINGKIYDVTQELTREDFESLVGIDVRDAMSKVDSVIEEAHLTPRDIDLVLLIGGSSRVPQGAPRNSGTLWFASCLCQECRHNHRGGRRPVWTTLECFRCSPGRSECGSPTALSTSSSQQGLSPRRVFAKSRLTSFARTTATVRRSWFWSRNMMDGR